MRSRIFNRVLREYLHQIDAGRDWKKWKQRNHKWFIGKAKDKQPNGRAVVFDGRAKYLGGALFDVGRIYQD